MFMVMMAFAAGIRVSVVHAAVDFSKATNIKAADVEVELPVEEGGTYVYHLLVNGENPYIFNFNAKSSGFADCEIYVNGEAVYSRTGMAFFDEALNLKPGDKVYFVMMNVRKTGNALVRFAEVIYESRVDVGLYGTKGEGGWSYDSAHHILTLNGYHGEWIGITDLMEAARDAERTDFTIVVEGENVLYKEDSSANSIQALGVDLTIKGSGTLDLSSAGGGSGIQVEGSLTIDGPVINYKGEGYGVVVYDGYSYIDDKSYERIYEQAGNNGNNVREFFTMKSGILNVDIDAYYYNGKTIPYYSNPSLPLVEHRRLHLWRGSCSSCTLALSTG